MASSAVRKSLKILNHSAVRAFNSTICHLNASASAAQIVENTDHSKPAATSHVDDDNMYIEGPAKTKHSSLRSSGNSATMAKSSMTGSIVGKRFYNEVTTREADDGNGWNVMLDYRTLRTPSKRNLNCPTLALAKAIAAEWEYQQTDGIRPFTMPLMKLACTALERVPLTRQKIIEHLMKKFHQDLVFCLAPGDGDLTRDLRECQVKKLDPLLNWVESEFGFKPVVYTSFFGGKQEDGLVDAIENLLKKTDDYELAAIDAIAAAAHSLVIAIGVFRGRLDIKEATELIRLEEDLRVNRWGLVEGGHDIDIADLRVQVSSLCFLDFQGRNSFFLFLLLDLC